MRLDLADALGPDLLEPRHAVRQGPLVEGREPRQLPLVERDHELAAALERDVVRLAEAPRAAALPSRHSRALSEPGA